MTLNGAPYAPRNPREARQAGVAMIYQELSLAPHLSVMDNIALGVEPRARCRSARSASSIATRCRTRRARRSSSSAIRRFPLTRRSASCRPRRSSWSKSRARWRSAAACSCSTSRRAASRTTTYEKLFELIRRLKQQGLAIVYISHFIEEVMQVSDRFVVLRDGRNAGEGHHIADARGDHIVEPDGRPHARGSVSARLAHDWRAAAAS